MTFELLTIVEARGVMPERRIRGSVDAALLEQELQTALGEAMGCGGAISEEHLATIEQQLLPIWSTLPKNAAGNIERRSLRYLIHRHFGRQSALQIRGFEPSRSSNASGWGEADILAQRVPAFVESFLESSHKLERGFNTADVVRVVATIERLIFDSEGGTLETVYGDQGRPVSGSLDRRSLDRLLEAYMLRWMLGDDEEGIEVLSKDRGMLEETVPHWQQIVAFARGEADALDYQRRQLPGQALAESAARAGHNAMEARYSFEDAHRIVGGITKSFASFWDSECRSMKATLVDMDTHHTGRVPLSKFYSHGLDTEWRFGESEEYLRDLGALDETSWRGKQVIISNYIQATSNCIVSSEHYLVCCVNDCESILEEIEGRIGEPTAEPGTILAALGNITSHSATLEEQPPQLSSSLTQQLEEIAATHGGRVPLHGRLFGQFLHYVFPRECPFPHKTGTVATLTPTEFGDKYIASSGDMERHAAEANATDLHVQGLSKDELQWMSQWSAEEELVADYAALGLRAPWERRGGAGLVAGLGLLLAAAAWRTVGAGRAAGGAESALPVFGKSHFV